MALARYEGTAVDTAGNVIPNATVEVRRDQPGRPVVPLFSDRDGLVAIGNPIQTNAEGQFAFHASGGVYYIRIFTGPSQQPTFQHIRRYAAIGTAAERDVEDLATTLEAGTATFPTLAELEAFVPGAEGVGGKVTTGNDAGFYHYDPIEEEWVFDRPLYDSIAEMTVTGGTANGIEAELDNWVADSAPIVIRLVPASTNTGPVTINGIPLNDFQGMALEAGFIQANAPVLLSAYGDGSTYRLYLDHRFQVLAGQVVSVRDQTEAFRDEAETFRNQAEASADSALEAKNETDALVVEAEQARDAAIDAAENSGNILFFASYAEAETAAAALNDGQIVRVLADETHDGNPSWYSVDTGALIYISDQTTSRSNLGVASLAQVDASFLINEGASPVDLGSLTLSSPFSNENSPKWEIDLSYDQGSNIDLGFLPSV